MNRSAQGVHLTRHSLTHHFSSRQSHRRKEEQERLKADIVYHIRGFCINMKLCKMWGSNERHFLLWVPTSFEKNSISREAKIARRALIMPSSETILQRRMKGPGRGLQLRGDIFFSLGKAKEKITNISWAPPRHFHIPKSSLYPCKVGVISPILEMRKLRPRGEVKQPARAHETSK